MYLFDCFYYYYYLGRNKHSFIKPNIQSFHFHLIPCFDSVKASPQWRSKVLCVLKKGVKRITRDGFRSQLQLGEVPRYPMEHLPVVISEVTESLPAGEYPATHMQPCSFKQLAST